MPPCDQFVLWNGRWDAAVYRASGIGKLNTCWPAAFGWTQGRPRYTMAVGDNSFAEGRWSWDKNPMVRYMLRGGYYVCLLEAWSLLLRASVSEDILWRVNNS